MVGAATGTVRVEIVPWLTQHFGSGASSRVILEAPVEGPTTLRALLAALAETHPGIEAIVVDIAADDLYDHVNVVHNDTLLASSRALDQPLAPGDTLVLLPAFTGG